MTAKKVGVKMCRGHFHAPGTLVSLDKFYVHKSGTRAGKPFSQCIECTLWRRFNPKGDPNWNDFVPAPDDVIDELRRRIGPVEAARRAGCFIDLLNTGRRRKHPTMRRSTVEKLVSVLADARERGEDNFDPNDVRRAQLIAGGPPGAREKAVLAMQEMWRRRRQERDKLARLAARGPSLPQDLYLAERYPVKPTEPDETWWHFTGQEWLPRWGEEMLGKDF